MQSTRVTDKALQAQDKSQQQAREQGQLGTWLKVDLSFLLPFLLARAFASAAAAAATAEEDFLAAGFLTLGGTFLKPPCKLKHCSISMSTQVLDCHCCRPHALTTHTVLALCNDMR